MTAGQVTLPANAYLTVTLKAMHINGSNAGKFTGIVMDRHKNRN